MSEQNKKTVPELERIELEPKEIMRLSVFETEKGFATAFLTEGPQGPMMEAFMAVADKIDLICAPKLPPILEDGDIPVAVAVCFRGVPEDSEDESESQEN